MEEEGMIYTLFKFLHICSAIVWLGGTIAVSVLTARIAREHDGTVLAAIARQSRFFGAAVIGPAAGLTLIAGIVMIATSGLGAPLWVIWGFAAIVVSIGLGPR
jgi:putative copper export protein